MKIATREIEALVKAPQKHNAVFLYGPDEGLVRHRAQAIAEAWLGPDADPTARISLTGDTLKEDPARLLDALHAMSLLGDAQVITLRDLSETQASLVEEAFDAASPSHRLVVLAGDLATKSSLRKAAEAHATCACVPCYKEEGRGLESLIRDTLTGFGLRAEPEALAYLQGHLQGDRMIILGELEKLSLYMGDDEQVDLATVQLVIGDNNESNTDALCYAISGGDVVRAMRLLDKSWQLGESPVMILRALQRHFLRFQELEIMAQQCMRGEAAVKQLRPFVFFKYQSLLANQSQRWQGKKLHSALQLLQKTESDCKSTSQTVELLCAHASLQLAKAA